MNISVKMKIKMHIYFCFIFKLNLHEAAKLWAAGNINVSAVTSP